MTTSLQNSATHYDDAQLRARVRAAIIAQAIAVSTEPESTTKHETRAQLARMVLREPTTMLLTFVGIVADNDAISAKSDPSTVTDAQIGSVVVAVWTAVASTLAL